MLITGDFNQPDTDWSGNVSPKNPAADCKANEFFGGVRDYFCANMSRSPHTTNESKTQHTLVFTNEENMVAEVQHGPPVGKIKRHQILNFIYLC